MPLNLSLKLILSTVKRISENGISSNDGNWKPSNASRRSGAKCWRCILDLKDTLDREDKKSHVLLRSFIDLGSRNDFIIGKYIQRKFLKGHMSICGVSTLRRQ